VYAFDHENVLGTSLGLTFIAPSNADAERAEAAALAEVERLRRIISSYDIRQTSRDWPRPAIRARVNRPDRRTRPVCVLEYAKRGRVFTRVTVLTDLWKAAAVSGRLPSDDALAGACERRPSLGGRWTARLAR